MNIDRTPHDRFFYQVMRHKKKAMAFLARYLPKEILHDINLEEITLAESKHSSEQWGTGYSDIIYQCKFNRGAPGHLFITCEHQSTPDKRMPLRLIKYNVDTIEKHMDQGGDKYPIVVNIVLYNGRKPWNYSKAFGDHYCRPVWGKKFWQSQVNILTRKK